MSAEAERPAGHAPEIEGRPPRAGFRRQILEAARRIVDEQGLHAATTRHIAALAGCAEGTIYRHFEDKHALFLELVGDSFPEFVALVDELPERAGRAEVRDALLQLGRAATTFYRAVLPFVGGAIVDRELLEQQRRRFADEERGPLHAFRQVERYLRAERDLGRLAPGASPSHAAAALLGACFARAFLDVWLGEGRPGQAETDEAFVAGVVDALLEGLRPQQAHRRRAASGS